MSDRHETIAEKRRLAEQIQNNLSTVLVRQWHQQAEIKSLEDEADRLEAAHKREAAFHAMTREANDRLREHLQIALDADRCELGNCAKLREALEMVRDAHYTKEVGGELYEGFGVEADDGTGRPLICIVENALAAPPRNCDRPECATTKAAQEVWRREDGGKTAYYEWLLATTTEQKGANNGNE